MSGELREELARLEGIDEKTEELYSSGALTAHRDCHSKRERENEEEHNGETMEVVRRHRPSAEELMEVDSETEAEGWGH